MAEIRPFTIADTEQLYALCLETGHFGKSASHLYGDPQLLGHIYVGPYAALEPELVLVLADGPAVAGYALGSLRTAQWEDRLEREWWPRLRETYVEPTGHSEGWTIEEARAHMVHHPRLVPPEITAAYPAHMHLKLLPHAQGKGFGKLLLRHWLDLAARGGAPSVHVRVNKSNSRAIIFWQHSDFASLASDERTRFFGRHLRASSQAQFSDAQIR